MIEIPKPYTMSKFHAYVGNVVQNRTFLNGSCPICREGKSFGNKKRLFYFFNDDYLYCHNCVKHWTPYFWIKEVSGMSFKEIIHDIKEYSGYDVVKYVEIGTNVINERIFQLPDLPEECVNLKDSMQLEYYKNYHIVNVARDYCKKRRLFSALNSPKALYVCLKDNYHRNRLIIPFYNDDRQITCYTSRALLDTDIRAKYLLKYNAEKPIFNLDKVDVMFPYIFVFEGPIDSLFIKNGVSINGVSMTAEQKLELNSKFPFHEIIWVFDNFRNESKEVVEKIKKKIKEGERVFLYNGDFENDKDLNEYCVRKNLDSVNPDLIINDCAKGLEGLLHLRTTT